MLLQKKYLDNADISTLPQEKQQEILNIKNSIRFDNESIATYSQGVSKKLTDFSGKILDTVKLKDSPEIETLLVELMGELDTLDTTSLMEKRHSFLHKLFKSNELKTFIMKYDSVAQIISSVKAKLEQAEYQLRKDIKTTEMYLQNNAEYIEELDKYIIAAKLKINEEENIITEMKSTADNEDLLQVQEIAIRDSELASFKRKIHNLELQRTIAIQNIPQLLILKQGDSVLVEKINDSIASTIPLWESQMVIAITTLRQESGVKLSKSVTDTTNKILLQNSEALKQSAIGVATELERDIVDIDTLKKSNENLIQTFKEIREIRAEGARKRDESYHELQELQIKLNDVLLKKD